MGLDHWKLVFDFAAIIVSLAALAYAHFRTKARATQAEIDELGHRQGRLSDRIGVIEGELRHVPEAQAIHDLRVTVEEIRGAVGAIATEVSSVKDSNKATHTQLDRIHNYLLQAKA